MFTNSQQAHIQSGIFDFLYLSKPLNSVVQNKTDNFVAESVPKPSKFDTNN